MNERYIINELCRIVLRTNCEIIRVLGGLLKKTQATICRKFIATIAAERRERQPKIETLMGSDEEH